MQSFLKRSEQYSISYNWFSKLWLNSVCAIIYINAASPSQQ